MSTLNRFRKVLIAMTLVACLALGGLYGCATSDESSAPPTGSQPPSSTEMQEGTSGTGAMGRGEEAIGKE